MGADQEHRMTNTIFLYAAKPLLGNFIKESLQIVDNDATLTAYSNETWCDLHKQQLKENKASCIVLAGFSRDKLDQWLWSTLRCEQDLLNPIIVLGYELEDIFCAENPAFQGGLSRYHRYLTAPWSSLGRVLQEIKPLHDDWTREMIFNEHGGSNLYKRLFRTLHEVKCINGKKEIQIARNAYNIGLQIADQELQSMLMQLIAVLQTNKLERADRIKEDIEKIIQTLTKEEKL